MKNKILVLTGPTAVGKTKLSLQLAKELNGEIISTDSMQIYRHMDIGSAKITEEEMQGIKHHMIDVIDPNISFSVADYKKMASEIINNIISRGKTPILTGGTGLYINSLTCNMDFTEANSDITYRNELEKIASERGNEYIHNMLKEVDIISYEKIHYNNRKRVIRALEVYKLTGRPFSSFDLGDNLYESKYDVRYVVLNMDRKLLYERIDKRVDMMIENGLVCECMKLKDMGYDLSMQSMQGIGYKEIFYYLEDKMSLLDAIGLIKKASRNYAKRQITWFKRDPRALFIDKDNMSEKDILKNILQSYKM